MILELDCGNSLIKWRILDKQHIVARGATAHSDELLKDIRQTKLPINACRLVSVRAETQTNQLIQTLENSYSITVQQAQSLHTLGKLSNGYNAPHRLGADRWLALLAVHHYKQHPALILSFGTAITSDFITQTGEHLGGFIAPGVQLMCQRLLDNTKRIYYQKESIQQILMPVKHPGKSTEDAVNGGCHLMVKGFLAIQQQLAEQYFGNAFDIYTTGGDASYFPLPLAIHKPDLVFEGLAIACPIEQRL